MNKIIKLSYGMEKEINRTVRNELNKSKQDGVKNVWQLDGI